MKPTTTILCMLIFLVLLGAMCVITGNKAIEEEQAEQQAHDAKVTQEAYLNGYKTGYLAALSDNHIVKSPIIPGTNLTRIIVAPGRAGVMENVLK